MKSFWSKKSRKGSGKEPLIETNNNEDTPDGNVSYGEFDNPLVQNTFNSQTECLHHSSPLTALQWGLQGGGGQDVKVETLAEVLRVNQDCISVGSYRSESGPGVNSQRILEQTVVLLIQASVHKHLPEPPADLESGLKTHLEDVQNVVVEEMVRLAPLFKRHGLMGKLKESYHRGVFKQMNDLLQRVSSPRNCFQLLYWVHTYPRLDLLLLNDDIQASDLTIDLVLLTDWTQQAQDKLLRLVQQKNYFELNNILEREGQQPTCQSEEDYVGLYVDVIKCIDAAPSEAQKFSPELSLKLTAVCLKDLLTFVTSYKSQKESLKKGKMAEPDLVPFFKILKTCKELKQHVQTKRKVSSVVEEIEVLLKETETFTLKVLLETVADFTERGLKKYFKSNHRKCFLMNGLEERFTTKPWLCLDEHKRAMDEVYKLIVILYCKHLKSHKRSKLVKCWSPDCPVAHSVAEDAELIHGIMSGLCLKVERWNFLLEHISDLLMTSDIGAIKATAGAMQQECTNKRCMDDTPLKDLLLWMGRSKSDVKQILYALEELSDQDHVRPKTWCICCFR